MVIDWDKDWIIMRDLLIFVFLVALLCIFAGALLSYIILPMMGAPGVPDFGNITNLEGGLV